MLVMIEKHKQGFALRIKSGYSSGNLIAHTIGNPIYWSNEDQCKNWADNTGYELIRTHIVYRNLEICKGFGRFYVFNFAGQYLFSEYNFKKEQTAKEIIDWHSEFVV